MTRPYPWGINLPILISPTSQKQYLNKPSHHNTRSSPFRPQNSKSQPQQHCHHLWTKCSNSKDIHFAICQSWWIICFYFDGECLDLGLFLCGMFLCILWKWANIRLWLGLRGGIREINPGLGFDLGGRKCMRLGFEGWNCGRSRNDCLLCVWDICLGVRNRYLHFTNTLLSYFNH